MKVKYVPNESGSFGGKKCAGRFSCIKIELNWVLNIVGFISKNHYLLYLSTGAAFCTEHPDVP